MEQTSSINLLPDQGHSPSKVSESQRISFAIAIGILGLTAIIAVLVEGAHLFLDGLNGSYISRIEADQQQLSSLQPVEVLYRGIDSKLRRLQVLLADYPYGSVVLDDVASLTPSGVKLSSLSFDTTGKVTITGISQGPGAFGQFVNILKDKNQGGKKFSSVDVTSLTGNGKDNSYNFTLTMVHKSSGSPGASGQ
jgi:hypothetical protein